MEETKLLDVFIEERLSAILVSELLANPTYVSAQKELAKANSKLDKLSLDTKQEKAVRKVVEAAIYTGAVYGTVAYKQGITDGLRLRNELQELSQN